MIELGYRPFDADNHYYEAEDAFTRYVDKDMQRRGVQWVDINGRRRILVAGRLDRFIPNPTFDPITKPGALEDYFRGENPSGKTPVELFEGNIEPLRPEYRDRDARLRLLDELGIDGVLLFPTLGCGVEQPLRNDPQATLAVLSGFNRWLEDEWPYAYQDRLYSVPMLSLADVDLAIAELERVLNNGARVVYLRAAPVVKGDGRTVSPGHPDHDPFWARVNDAGVTIALHTGDSGYSTLGRWEQARELTAFGGGHTFGMMTQYGRPIMDTIAAYIAHGVFHRFPNLRVATIECGSFWVPWLFANMKKTWGQMNSFLPEDPRETFKRHVYVAPFFEDDVHELIDLIGVDRVLFGSDFPHAEGLADPLSYVTELAGLDASSVRMIMHDNGRSLVERKCA